MLVYGLHGLLAELHIGRFLAMQYDFSWNSWNPNVNFFKINAIKKPFKDLFNVNEALVSLFELLKCDSRLILCKRPFLKKSWLQREIWCLTHFLFWSENITYLAGQEREQQLQKAEIPRISKQLFDLLYRSRLNFNVSPKFSTFPVFVNFSGHFLSYGFCRPEVVWRLTSGQNLLKVWS